MNSPNEHAAMSIAAVERDTGLAKDTLRVWERRYGFPQPARDACGERAYPPEQVEKLRLIKRLLDQGERPGRLIRASPDELSALLGSRQGTSAAAPDAAPSELAVLLPLIREHRGDALRAALNQSLLKRGLQRFVMDVVAPLNRHIGEAWLRGEIEVAEEHLYTEQMQNVLRGAISAHPGAAQPPRVLLTTLPEEEHALGLLMAEAMLAAEGAQCVSLGTRTPLTDIRSAALMSRAQVVALSFSAAYPARQAQDALSSLRALLPAGVAIWAGGAGIARVRDIEGVRRIGGIAEILDALREWQVGAAG
jgi:DNA-binding transcriptional MerR regulator/methylmalonyl-CoA mutase cobalamin-binding subunit